MSMEIVRVDGNDAVAFAAWHDAYATAQRHDRGADLADVWTAPELQVKLTETSVRGWQAAYAGIVDGRTVAAGYLWAPLKDNLDRAEIDVNVVPERRRRGLGTAMLEHLVGVAAEQGRTILAGEAAFPYDGPADGTGSSGPEFARAHGFSLALGEVKRQLRLPVADSLLEELAGETAAHHGSYTLRSWVGPVPDDLVEGFLALDASLPTEAPTGEVELEPHRPDVGAHLEMEATMAKQGRMQYCTVALDADGTAVAYTMLATTIHEPGRAYQWGTLVRRDHRGHRLGLAVKVANLRLLQAERPDISSLTTYNAEVNTHMIGVNERLGFVPVERFGQFQRKFA